MLDGLLSDDVVFYSPVVCTPVHGRDLTSAYVQAAAQVLRGDSAFRYPKEVMDGDLAMLEFGWSLFRLAIAQAAMAIAQHPAVSPCRWTSWNHGSI